MAEIMSNSQLLSKRGMDMYQKERIESIMDILKENGYVTVKYLTKVLHYSNATINRDLNVMENQKLVARTYGGVELCENVSVPLEFRYHKEKISKRKISKLAADFISDGDTVFIDSSTTTERMGDFMTNKKNITVITNNMALAAHLSEYIPNVICTGGRVVESPYMLDGIDTIRTILAYNMDKMFFSTGGVSDDGIIKTGSDTYSFLCSCAMKNSKKKYFLIDHTKINVEPAYNIADFSQIDAVISDYRFPDDTKKKYADTEFYEV